jgi:hypothetical protein
MRTVLRMKPKTIMRTINFMKSNNKLRVRHLNEIQCNYETQENVVNHQQYEIQVRNVNRILK